MNAHMVLKVFDQSLNFNPVASLNHTLMGAIDMFVTACDHEAFETYKVSSMKDPTPVYDRFSPVEMDSYLTKDLVVLVEDLDIDVSVDSLDLNGILLFHAEEAFPIYYFERQREWVDRLVQLV